MLIIKFKFNNGISL